ncbi:hypothetical protein [Winogradskyella sp. UBA3174]|uniref:hypothetical protein n=1 Tax=Winogradskyella sp. UBA3174 TaxID=1947785 RepID=UPI0025E6E0DB|nr:hypothetical protein [Winogradskyella sp. UBA3174]|tara:strand:- start:2045 stop:2254 length:210 start_codon:yes stop_codon:yes gene_type:complete
MKNKVFSFVAVVLFMSSSLNVNTNMQFDDNSACFDYADKWANIVGFWNSLSHYDEYLVFEALYDDCINQ